MKTLTVNDLMEVIENLPGDTKVNIAFNQDDWTDRRVNPAWRILVNSEQRSVEIEG